MLQDCNERNLNLKKMFCWVGFDCASKLTKQIKSMDKNEEFGCIMNWILHKMPKREAVTVRFEINSQTYQVKICHNGQRLHVNKPVMMKTVVEPVLYDWQGEETYNTLTADEIRNSIQRADQMNDLKMQEMEWEMMELFNLAHTD